MVDIEQIGTDLLAKKGDRLVPRVNNKNFLFIYDGVEPDSNILNQLETNVKNYKNDDFHVSEYSISKNGDKTYAYVEFDKTISGSGKQIPEIFSVNGQKPTIRKIASSTDKDRVLEFQSSSENKYTNIGDFSDEEREEKVNKITNYVQELSDVDLDRLSRRVDLGKGLL